MCQALYFRVRDSIRQYRDGDKHSIFGELQAVMLSHEGCGIQWGAMWLVN